MSIHRGGEKAHRYLEQLELARCNGRWDEVTELSRKLSKHWPQRKCLILTARSEAEISTHTIPNSVTTASVAPPITRLVPELRKAIDQEHSFPEDSFHAQTCLGWLLWIMGEESEALSVLPVDLPYVVNATNEKSVGLGGWTNVCMIKSACIRGTIKMNTESSLEVYRIFEAVLPGILAALSSSPDAAEFRRWSERLLSCACAITSSQSPHVKSDDTTVIDQFNPDMTLAPFRTWAKLWESGQVQTIAPTARSKISGPMDRRAVWSSYYRCLSHLLQTGLTYPSSNQGLIARNSAFSVRGGSRRDQSAELLQVGQRYEDLLMKETSFPHANEVNAEVEDWVDLVMSNWRIICGSTWDDEDISNDGQEGVSREVLEILYRAASRSFHSTAILRHLFTVHASLAEFELARKALDSYVEIVIKGKARGEKSGLPEPALDGDEEMLHTMAAGIEMLCTFGQRKEALRARDLADLMEKWLSSPRSETTNGVNGQTKASSSSMISPQTRCAAYRAVGVSYARWAQLTYAAPRRSELQSMAISKIREALRVDPAVEEDSESLHALALVLAETRDLDAAVTAVKLALATATSGILPRNRASEQSHTGQRSHGSIKNWHLLALLLSARQDFETAEASCKAAFGSLSTPLPARSKSIYQDFHTRQQLIEVKMTQVALIEVLEGPDVAINAGSELLTLYSELFGEPIQEVQELASKPRGPPKTANGTIKSFRASIFGSTKSLRTFGHDGATRPRRSSHETSRPPTISITKENPSTPMPTTHSQPPTRRSANRLQKNPSQREARRSRTLSPGRGEARSYNGSLLGSRNGNTKSVVGESGPPYSPSRGSTGHDDVGIAVSSNTPHRTKPTAFELECNTIPGSSLAVGVSATNGILATTNGRRSPEVPYPAEIATAKSYNPVKIPPCFARADQRRYITTLLTRLWLLVAGLYRRAKLLGDARGAVDEAFEQAKIFDVFISAQSSSVRSFEARGWGHTQSAEELWADIYAELGHIEIADDEPHTAMQRYEAALTHFPDHTVATIGLANVLLDIYSEATAMKPGSAHPTPSAPSDTTERIGALQPLLANISPPQAARHAPRPSLQISQTLASSRLSDVPPEPATRTTDDEHHAPRLLDRLAARDRAYGLLSALTKLGTAWDDGTAWFALARASEASGEVEKAKEMLWWVVELEEKRPVRNWSCLGQGYGL